MEVTWKNLAASESRLKMMDKLRTLKVGFNDVEHFNLGLLYNSKNVNCNNYAEKDDRKIVELAMKFKRKDEILSRKRIIKEKLDMRKRIEKELGESMKIKVLKHLNGIFERKKIELNEKYDKKITHLRQKYEKDDEKELDKIPEEMEGLEGLTIFSKEGFENIVTKEIEVVRYGDVEIDKDEEAALKLHPKMALPRKLEEGFMSLNMDLSYTKVRWQLSKEDEIGSKETLEMGDKDKELRKKREEELEVEEAKTRMVYDSESRVYDERKQRVTDLKECSRVFLPRPLEVQREAQLEMRREVHEKISKEFRKEKCDEKGRQENNLTREETRGLRKLEKRKNEGEIVIIQTDKSSKLCIMRREDYLKLGEDHVGKDEEIGRKEVVEIEKLLNQHAMSWVKMWKTGQDHDHEDRIRQSKVSRSENRADLYLSYKDHKKVPGKTRPIATGCTSNTLALSNSLSNLVESLANAEEKKHEIISTEDLMYNAKSHDKLVEKMRMERLRKILRKIRCRKSRENEMSKIVEEVLEEVMRKEGGEGSLAGLLEGKGTLLEKGTLTHPEPAPDILLEDQGTSLGTLIPHGEEEGVEGGEVQTEDDLKREIEKEMEVQNEELKRLISNECDECGPPVEDLEFCLLGLDVSALFPSMSAKRTGEILRSRMMKSQMEVKGFNWRMGLVYILMNKHLTTNLGKMWKILPYRKKVGGTAPGMASQGMSGKNGKVEDQWVFKVKEVTREQLMEIVGRCVEIAVRVVFEHFTYNFGGKIYLQKSGGPIGNRLTMACSRVVMQDWGEKYLEILEQTDIITTMFKIYVDDVRQVSTILREGMRFDEELNRMVWKEEYKVEDERKREEGESVDARMIRILMPAINSINSDLVFTSELREDFRDGKLPTLDCNLWFEEDWSLNHTYYEKDMRSQLVIPERSAMATRQKYNILSNDLVRRLSNINMERVQEDEKIGVVEHFITQLKTSG